MCVMWFDTWNDVVRILVIGVSAYGSLIVILRISGKRTLAKLNAFDFVISVALGSALSTIILDRRTSLVDGLVALGLLVALQLVVAFLTARLPSLRTAVTAGPTVLFTGGEARRDAMRRHRVSDEEVRQAVRAVGIGELGAVDTVVLETNGTLSVIGRSAAGDRSALPAVDD